MGYGDDLSVVEFGAGVDQYVPSDDVSGIVSFVLALLIDIGNSISTLTSSTARAQLLTVPPYAAACVAFVYPITPGR